MKNKILSLIAVALLCVIFSAENFAQKLKPEEIIAKNLESIGSMQKRGEIKNYFGVGISQFTSKLPSKKALGKIVLVSDAANFFYLSSFNSKEYPFEKIGFFKDDVNLPYVIAGARSPLGAFIADHKRILSDGLFAGSMSLRWNSKKGKYIYDSQKKIDGKKVYVLEYFPDTGSQEFSVKLFFDAENYRHVRSEYRHIIAEKQNQFGTFGQQSGLKIEMTEEFADFQTVDGITLPYSYRITYLTESTSGTYEYDWTINLTQYYFNQKLDPNFFTFESK